LTKPERLPSAVDGQTYFITSNTYDRQTLFRYETFAKLFIETLYEYRRQSKYQIHPFVVMPEHFHLLLTPARGVTIERALQLIKGGYSYRVKTELHRSFEVWQPGFTDRRVRVGEYGRMVEYIEQNPVKAGLVKNAKDYPYGSASGLFDLDPAPSYLSG
jgi:putative transposase